VDKLLNRVQQQRATAILASIKRQTKSKITVQRTAAECLQKARASNAALSGSFEVESAAWVAGLVGRIQAGRKAFGEYVSTVRRWVIHDFRAVSWVAYLFD
jgi:hypothetical protein